MNDEQAHLYKQWKEVEERLTKFQIDINDILKANELRPRVWNEIRNFLPIDEKFELGVRLEKKLSEIYDQKYPPGHWPLSKQWATRAIYRAHTGLTFLLECLEEIHQRGTDPVYSRSAYTLLSFNVELLFSGYVLLQETHINKTARELMGVLRTGGNHNLEGLTSHLDVAELEILGIQYIKMQSKNGLRSYCIALLNGETMVVEDLIDVRYDYKYDTQRDIDPEESQRMRKEASLLREMTAKIMDTIPTE